MKTSFRVSCISFAITLALCSNAQIKTKIFPQGVPESKMEVKMEKIPIKILNPPKEFLDIQKSEKTPTEYSNRFAIAKTVNLDFLAEAKLVEVNGFAIYLCQCLCFR